LISVNSYLFKADCPCLRVLGQDVVDKLGVKLHQNMLKNAAQRRGEDHVQNPFECCLSNQFCLPECQEFQERTLHWHFDIYIYLFFAHIPLDLIKLYSSWARTKDARGDRRNPAGVVWQTISLGQKHGSTAAYSGQRAACHSSSLSKGPSESSEIVKKELGLTPSNRLCVQGRCKE
jgi:hypothetical protein